MKLNYRDKVLLISVLVILVWVAGVMLFIKPAFDDLNDANATYDSKVMELEDKKDQIKADEDLPERVTKAYDEVTTLAGNFYKKLTTDEVSETIDNLLDADNITNDSLSISSYSSVVLSTIVPQSTEVNTEIDNIVSGNASDGDAAAAATTEDTSVTVPSYTVSFGFTCKFSDLKSFLDKLTTNNEKSLVVANCTITDVNESEIQGTMSMVLMMMPEIQNPLEADKADKASDSSSDAE